MPLTTDRLGTLTSRAQISRPLPSAFGERVGTAPVTPYGWKAAWGYRESSPGLTHIGHRMYDPTTGRFLTRDPILDGSHHFAYCDNDPLNNIDPTGLWDISILGFEFSGETLSNGLRTGIGAVGESLSFGIYDDKYAKGQVGYGEARFLADIGVEAGLTATGAGWGMRAAGTAKRGLEFSHWIPNRYIKSMSNKVPSLKKVIKKFGESKWNGNYVSPSRHAKHDPFRFLKGQKRTVGSKYHPVVQQLDRVPKTIRGTGAGAGSAAVHRKVRKG